MATIFIYLIFFNDRGCRELKIKIGYLYPIYFKLN